MKSKYIVAASALLISVGGFAQKDQMKAAEKALKSGDPKGALASLAQAEPLLASDDDKAQYYLIKGNVHLDLAKKNVEAGNNYMEAAKAYESLFDTEKKSGKPKYTKLGEMSELSVIAGLKSDAFKDYKNKDFKDAAVKFYEIYNLDKTDTDFLFNASNAAYLAQDDDQALAYLDELKSINYTGERTDYTAVSKLTKEKEYFDSQKTRDEAVKSGSHDQPGEEKVLSKRGEIYKQYANILMKKGKLEEAKSAISEARKLNPDDAYLALSEANLYYQAKDMEMYKKLIEQILEKDPDNKELIMNLGIVSYSNKDYDNAEKFYKKVLALDPDYPNASFNLSAVKIDQAEKLLDEMNQITGTSAAENKKYDALKKQRDALLVEIMGYLEKAVALDDKNTDAKVSLASVYSALEMTDKAKAMKEKIKAQEGE